MAVQDTEWAYSLDLPAPQKAVLLALAFCRNGKTGLCYPGQKEIQRMTGLSDATVRRSLGALDKAGIISRQPTKKDGYRGNDMYTFHQSEGSPVTVNTDQPEQRSERQPSPVTVTPITGHSDGAVEQTGIQPELNRNLFELDVPREVTKLVSFDSFYSIWPKKRDRPAAQRAWVKATKKTSPTVILAAANAYANNPHRKEIQFVPYPATWLNREGWSEDLDGPDEVRGRANHNDRNLAYIQQLAQQETQPKGISA